MSQKDIPESVLSEDNIDSTLNHQFEFFDSLIYSRAYRLKFVLLILGLYILLTPVLNGLGLPSLMSLMICFVMVVLPFEVGYLYNKARRQGKDSSLSDILVNEFIERKKRIGIIIGGVFLSILVAGLAQTLDASI